MLEGAKPEVMQKSRNGKFKQKIDAGNIQSLKVLASGT